MTTMQKCLSCRKRDPDAARGLCWPCYGSHRRGGSLDLFPTKQPAGRDAAIPLIEGISYRQLDFWVRRGYLHPVHAGGSGTYRHWPDEEVRVAKEMARLVAVGIPPSLAVRIARGQAPEVRVEVSA